MPVQIDGNPMPCQFKYEPLIPQKRKITKNTAAGTVTQSFNVGIIGSGDIPFSLISTPEDAAVLNTLYYDTDSFTFSGYYGDVYEGYIQTMKQTYKGGWVTTTGVFKVQCTTTPFSPTRNCS